MLSYLVLSSLVFGVANDIVPVQVITSSESELEGLKFIVRTGVPDKFVNQEQAKESGFEIYGSGVELALVHENVLGRARIRKVILLVKSILNSSDPTMVYALDGNHGELDKWVYSNVSSRHLNMLNRFQGLKVSVEQAVTVQVSVEGEVRNITLRTSEVIPPTTPGLMNLDVPQRSIGSASADQSLQRHSALTKYQVHTFGEKSPEAVVALSSKILEELRRECVDLTRSLDVSLNELSELCASKSGKDLLAMANGGEVSELTDFSPELQRALRAYGSRFLDKPVSPSLAMDRDRFWKEAKILSSAVTPVIVVRIPESRNAQSATAIVVTVPIR